MRARTGAGRGWAWLDLAGPGWAWLGLGWAVLDHLQAPAPPPCEHARLMAMLLNKAMLQEIKKNTRDEKEYKR